MIFSGVGVLPVKDCRRKLEFLEKTHTWKELQTSHRKVQARVLTGSVSLWGKVNHNTSLHLYSFYYYVNNEKSINIFQKSFYTEVCLKTETLITTGSLYWPKQKHNCFPSLVGVYST